MSLSPEAKAKVKALSLKSGEDHLVKATDDIIAVAEVIAADTENSFDDVGVNMLKMFKGELVKLIDKIDGVENQG